MIKQKSNNNKEKNQGKKKVKTAFLGTSKVKAEKPLELFYMNQKDTSVKQLSDAINEDFSLQIWPELSIMEIELSNKNSIDFVKIDTNYWDEVDVDYLKANSIEAVYAVTVMLSDEKELKKVCEKIKAVCGGQLVTDSDDFEPYIFK